MYPLIITSLFIILTYIAQKCNTKIVNSYNFSEKEASVKQDLTGGGYLQIRTCIFLRHMLYFYMITVSEVLMHNEITEVDVKKIKEELEYRKNVLSPSLHEEVKRTREYGDLSENDEYRTAKRERRRNDSRIRYLEQLLLTARIVKPMQNGNGGIGLFDVVEYRNERTGTPKKIQLVTSLRQDALRGFISKESPVGRALMGRRVGDRVHIEIGPGNAYDITVLSVEHGTDNEELPISRY